MKEKKVKDSNWMEMVRKQGELRHFGSLAIRKAQKGKHTSAQEIDLLFRAALSEEPMTPGQLTEAMGVSKTIISRVIDQLELKKLIEKEKGRSDKRSYVIRVTETGKKEIDDMYYYYLDPLYHLNETMGNEKFETLFRLIAEANEILASGK